MRVLSQDAAQVYALCRVQRQEADLCVCTEDGQVEVSSLIFSSLSPFLVGLLGKSERTGDTGERQTILLQGFRKESVVWLVSLLSTGSAQIPSILALNTLTQLLTCLGYPLEIVKHRDEFIVQTIAEPTVGGATLGGVKSSDQRNKEDDTRECADSVQKDDLIGNLEPEDDVIRGLSVEDDDIEDFAVDDEEELVEDLGAKKTCDKSIPVTGAKRKTSKLKSKRFGRVGRKTRSMSDAWEETKLVYADYMQVCGGEEYRCMHDQCDRVFKFNAKSNAMAHIFRHLDLKPFQCSQCQLEFHNIKDLQYHMRTHNKRYKCDQCEKAFPTMSKLTVHTRVHTGEKPFVCDNCGFRTNTQGTLTIHKRMHSNERSVVCNYPDCGEAFLYWPQLKRHKEIEHGENIEKRCCPICNHRLKTSLDVYKHMKAKHSEFQGKERLKKYMCSICGKGWVSEVALNNHMTSHSGEYNYPCTLCPQRCKLKSQLKRHLESFHADSHTLGHVCDQCGKAFASRYTLDNHVRVHTGEKPYKCTVCNQMFGWLQTFRKHQEKEHGIVAERKKRLLKTHEPSFHCSFPNCGRSFYSSYRYEMHTSKHTGKTSFQCEVCTAEFDSQQKVRDHERKRHKKYRSKSKPTDPSPHPSLPLSIDAIRGEHQPPPHPPPCH